MRYPKIQTLFKRDKERNYIVEPSRFSRDYYTNIKDWLVTEKIDGMNMRIIYNENGVDFRGRTDRAQIPEPLLGNLQNYFTEERFERVFDLDRSNELILYGEGYGYKIQNGGKYIEDDQQFILFDALVDRNVWMDFEFLQMLSREMDIPLVPIISYHADLKEIVDFVKEKPVSRLAPEGKEFVMEGVVCKTRPQLFDRFGNRVAFKLKVKDIRKYEREVGKEFIFHQFERAKHWD